MIEFVLAVWFIGAGVGVCCVAGATLATIDIEDLTPRETARYVLVRVGVLVSWPLSLPVLAARALMRDEWRNQ